MPLIYYSCECGLSGSKFFRQPKDAPSIIACKCGKDTKKQLKAPSSTSILTVDNGVQARSTEVNLEVVKDIQDRSTKDFKDK